MLRSALLLLALVASACSSRPIRGEEGAPKAVVLSLASQDATSQRIAHALNEQGYDVVRKSTSIPRAKSSMAIYDVRHHPERIDELGRLVRDELALDVEVLPFPQHATGGNAVVVWLGADLSN